MESISEHQGPEGAPGIEDGRGTTNPNSRERLKVSSGLALIIDQFMLANNQFLGKISQLQGIEQEDQLRYATRMFGGCIIRLEKGTYYVYRDPQQNLIVLTPAEGAGEESEEEQGSFDFGPVINAKGNLVPQYHVFVDTRCLVFIDAAKLFDQELIETYRQYRLSNSDKQGRDLLREHGAAVRYGFNRYGDELGVFELPEENIVALWPDVSSTY